MLKVGVHLDSDGRVLLSLEDDGEMDMTIQLTRQAAEALAAQLREASARSENVEALFGDVAAIFQPD